MADHLVSYGTVSGSGKNIGAVYVYGTVYALKPNKNKTHDAINFSGKFFGVDLGLLVGDAYTKGQQFKDSYKEPDVTRIKGWSSFTSITSSIFGRENGISMGLYNFGKLTSFSSDFGCVEGFDFGFTSVQGRTKLTSEIFQVLPEAVNEALGLYHLNKQKGLYYE